MAERFHTPAAAILLVASGVGLYFGWREFWFLTDDAFIAFRYVSNAVLGHGYVWNAEPFRAVEGYTSFLWVLILEFIWRVFGVEPPHSANVISLLFSCGTLVVSTIALLRMKLNSQLAPHRPVLVALLLVGLLTNTTFLTWTSSGLETALFNFCFTTWMVLAIIAESRGNLWRTSTALSSAAVYLARPDGMLVVVSTALLLALSVVHDVRRQRSDFRWILSILPILAPVLHLLWRKSYYGEWLPNTYYAKQIAAWPASGIRYVASFTLEYGLWVWLIVMLVWLVVQWRRYRITGQEFSVERQGSVTSAEGYSGKRPAIVIAVATLCLQVGYYTIVIGGDHFEWRVYSHLPPLLILSFIYFLNKLEVKPLSALSAVAMLIALSLPLPWAQHFAAKKVVHLEVVETMRISTSDKLPFILWPIARADDALQEWLNDHLVCVRRQEHKLFAEKLLRDAPDRTFALPDGAGQFPVAYFSVVGMAGWVLPEVAIIDGYGLNDYIVARTPRQPTDTRRMAHDRRPPEHYVYSFHPTVSIVPPEQVRVRSRPPEFELTAERIRAIEKYWEDRIIHGMDIPDSAAPFPMPPEPR